MAASPQRKPSHCKREQKVSGPGANRWVGQRQPEIQPSCNPEPCSFLFKTLTARCSCFLLWEHAAGTKYRSAPQVARNPCFATHLLLPTGHDVKGQCADDLSVVDMEEVRAV